MVYDLAGGKEIGKFAEKGRARIVMNAPRFSVSIRADGIHPVDWNIHQNQAYVEFYCITGDLVLE